MAMDEPCARIVGLEGDDNVAVSRKENDIATRGVVQLEIEAVGEFRVFYLLEDGEVVAM